MLVPMSSPTIASGDDDLLARIAQLEGLLAAAAVLHGVDKGAKAGLQDALAYSESIVDTVREPLLVLDSKLHVRTASHSFYRTFGVSAEQTIGKFVYDLGNGQWDIPELRRLLEEVLPQQKSFRNFEVVHEFSSIGLKSDACQRHKALAGGDDEPEGVLLAIEDVTARKKDRRRSDPLQRGPPTFRLCSGP